jgi:ubiquinone biosynthesis protein UbiJ
MLDAKRAEGIDAKVGFRLGAESFLGHLAAGRIEIERSDLEGADLIFTTSPVMLAAAVYSGQPLEAFEKSGELHIEGDRALAERFVTLFPLPPKAGR